MGNKKFILASIFASIFISFFFLNPETVSAQQACSWNSAFSSCVQLSSVQCPPGESPQNPCPDASVGDANGDGHIDANECNAKTLDDLNCTTPTNCGPACCYETSGAAANQCNPRVQCPGGQIAQDPCSDNNFDESGCLSQTSENCTVQGGGVCQWVGATSCEPVATCSGNSVLNPVVANLCHSPGHAGSFSDCVSASLSELPPGTQMCIQPDGWYCLPNSGTAAQCAFCFNSPPPGYTACAGQTLIPQSECSLCNTYYAPQAEPIKICCDGNGDPVACDDANSTGEIYTAIGCIPITDQRGFATWIIRWAIGVTGGIAIILIIYATFMVITSGGNPQRLQAGKELLTAAVMGLILLLFGAYILDLVGVSILGIPGL